MNTYWSGVRDPSATGCQCSIDGTCIEALNADSICNCDLMRADLVDEGILTDKNALPVKSLRYGGAYTTFSNIKYILGPLVCSGKAQPYPSEQAAIESEKVKNKLATISAKLNEIDNRKEPVYAFRVTNVEAGSSSSERVSRHPGEMFIMITVRNLCNSSNRFLIAFVLKC